MESDPVRPRLPASIAARKKSAERQAAAWQMYCSGLLCWEIGERLGITESAAARLKKKAAKDHPAAQMDQAQRSAVALQMLFDSHREVKEELQQAQAEGRRDDVRMLLNTQSLSASRCARVLEAQPDAVVQQQVTFNTAAFQLLTGTDQQQLPSVQTVTVEAEKA